MSFVQTVFAAFFLSIFCGGCGNTEPPQQSDRKLTNNYFDMKGFMESEIDRLAQITSFTKTVYVNEVKETKAVDQVNFENELKPFSDSDINKPAWADKYDIDSTFNQNKELIGLRYQSKDEKLKTKKINIDFEGKAVSKIFIENATNSNVANTYQTLTYLPKSGFSIESKQDVALLDENHFKIEVSFN